jgi:anaerobic magnesium-protoporphyrin IX monomethyl ester cyclase
VLRVALLVVVDESTPLRRAVQKLCPPLGLLYLQAWLQAHAPEVEVLVTWDVADVLRSEPHLIGLSSVTENFRMAEALASSLHATTGAPVLIGGAHISLVPQSLPAGCVAGVLGEGEQTLLELVRLLQQHGQLRAADLADVAGLVYRDTDGGLRRTPPRPVIRPLDSIPFPKRPAPDTRTTTHVITSRGCPFDCAFCSSATLTESYRMHSAEYVLDELSWIHEHVAPLHVKFFDDLFVANRKRVLALSELIASSGLVFPAGMSCFARTDLLDDELLAAMRRMGFTGLSIGIESGSPSILAKIGKRNSTERNQHVLDLCKKHGMITCCSFVIGWPGETEADLQHTHDFIERNRAAMHQVEICPAVPYPGTGLWTEARRQGIVSDDMDWSVLRDHSIYLDFDPDHYLYLNPAMPRDRFVDWTRTFRGVYQSFLHTHPNWMGKANM